MEGSSGCRKKNSVIVFIALTSRARRVVGVFVLFMILSSVGVCFAAEKIRSDVFPAGDIEGIICLSGEVLPFPLQEDFHHHG